MDGGSVDYAGAIIDRSMRVPFKMKQERGYPQDKLLEWHFFWLLSFKKKFCTWMYFRIYVPDKSQVPASMQVMLRSHGFERAVDSSTDETRYKKEFKNLKQTDYLSTISLVVPTTQQPSQTTSLD